MSHEKNRDESVINFIKAYAPKAKTPSPELQDKIYSALNNDIILKEPESFIFSKKISILVAGVTLSALFGISYFLWQRNVVEEKENASLQIEEFVQSTWEETFAENSDIEFQYLTDDLYEEY